MSHWQAGLVFKNADEFLHWLDTVEVTDVITEVHMHHTYRPNHANNLVNSTERLHNNMKNYHTKTLGWDDIAQHITIGKDGYIVTGRSINSQPASAKYHNGNKNAHPFMFEMIGDFDKGNDKFEGPQLDSALKVCQYFFRKGVKTEFHRQQLINGKAPKTCPGTGIDYGWWISLVEGKQVKVELPGDKNVSTGGNEMLPNGIIKPNHPGPNAGVKQIQKTLIELGYPLPKYGVDGYNGKEGGETIEALKKFQKDNKLTVDGIYGPNTRAAMLKRLDAKKAAEKAAAQKKAAEEAAKKKTKGDKHVIYVDGKRVHTLSDDDNVLLFVEQNMNKVKEIKIIKE